MTCAKVISRGGEVQRDIFALHWNKSGRSKRRRVREQTSCFALVGVTVGPATKNSRGARRHPVHEPEVIDHRKFFRRKHDLKSFLSELVHDETRCSK
jgi:hypothetical protein